MGTIKQSFLTKQIFADFIIPPGCITGKRICRRLTQHCQSVALNVATVSNFRTYVNPSDNDTFRIMDLVRYHLTGWIDQT